MSVILETTIGDIVIDLYTKDRPRACLNFLKLCKIKYYNFSLFHKVECNFIAQTGDPTGTGRGGESVFSKLYGPQAQFFEAENNPRHKHAKLGTVSMVNDGNDVHSSQFFITLAENLDYLDDKHTVFGEVAEGFEILEKFNETICDEDNRPYQDIRISHTIILDDPYDDPEGLEIPDSSPKPTKENLQNARIGADEEIDDTKGKTIEEIEEEIQDKEAKAQATILEMVGDLPEADAKPEDNVLFVCKLNPVTTDEDLQIIFSRFGTIKSCEVIKDKKSEESLQYAFIEFSNASECENAYFKMDNVLIDERRIHVDFSQSVAHLTWKNKRKGNEPSDEVGNTKYKLKDDKRKDNYDLVFEEASESKKSSKKSSHKHGKKRKSSTSSSHKKNKRDSSESDGNTKARKYSTSSSEESLKDEHKSKRGERIKNSSYNKVNAKYEKDGDVKKKSRRSSSSSSSQSEDQNGRKKRDGSSRSRSPVHKSGPESNRKSPSHQRSRSKRSRSYSSSSRSRSPAHKSGLESKRKSPSPRKNRSKRSRSYSSSSRSRSPAHKSGHESNRKSPSRRKNRSKRSRSYSSSSRSRSPAHRSGHESNRKSPSRRKNRSKRSRSYSSSSSSDDDRRDSRYVDRRSSYRDRNYSYNSHPYRPRGNARYSRYGNNRNYRSGYNRNYNRNYFDRSSHGYDDRYSSQRRSRR